MKEAIIALCMLNPCVTIPDTDIMYVPLPSHMLHPLTNPDDQGMKYCDECGFWIKYVPVGREA